MAKKPVIKEKTPEQKAEEYQKLQARWRAEDLAEKKELVDKQAAEDAEKEAKRMAQEEAEIQAKKKKAQAEYDKYLKTPLSVEEQVDYENILLMANSSTQPPDMTMRKLAEYRIRLKNNGDKNPR